MFSKLRYSVKYVTFSSSLILIRAAIDGAHWYVAELLEILSRSYEKKTINLFGMFALVFFVCLTTDVRLLCP